MIDKNVDLELSKLKLLRHRIKNLHDREIESLINAYKGSSQPNLHNPTSCDSTILFSR